MKDDRLYLIHIGECIQRIESYVAGGRSAFMASTLVQDAVVRNLQILAESTQRVSPALKGAHPEIDWRGIAGFRNILVHDYFGIDLEKVWNIVTRNLPDLKTKTEATLTSLGPAR
jgi:uncharacterized protein with HEPN domain